MRPASVAFAPLLLACSSQPAAPCSFSLPDAGTTRVMGTVTSTANGGQGPVPNAMIAVEYGGLYRPYCDLSHASPFYFFGSVTDSNGSFSIDVQPGTLGFHAFADGQYYARALWDTSKGNTLSMQMVPLGPQQPQPTVASAAFDATPVAPGARVTVTATVHAGTSSDPLSDEVILVEPTHSWAAELDPPAGGQKDNFPDGTWSRTFVAPMQTGMYTYWLEATTAGCATSALVRLMLAVQ